MSGDTIMTAVGRDAIAKMIMDNASYFKFGEGGFVLSGEAIEIIEDSASGTDNIYNYTVTGGDFEIVDVDTLTKTFSISGLYSTYFPAGTQIAVEGSTANDGKYTVASASEGGGQTDIIVNETIPDATIDGNLYVDHLPIARGYTTDATHHPCVVEEISPGPIVVQSMSDTTGTGNLTGTGGSGTVNYKSGLLHIVFNSNVGIGNQVRIRFKYHDVRKIAAVGEAYEDLESALSPDAPDGEPELFTYRKYFGGGTPPDTDSVFTSRGAGYGTVRGVLKLREWEGIDDGRAATWGGIPFYFEAGVFDADDVLIAYMTFDKTRHTGGNIVRHKIDFVV